ncbi:MAG: IclR family transcriptional regulator [Burkholderiales bacterium]|nr:IclR family transcriptional regulator [Burkholderiales bacterium]
MLTSVKRSAEIIEAFVDGQREWGVGELASHMGMPTPTVHHFLASFRKAGWIVQDPATRRYRLAIRLWEIGCAAVNFREVAESARPFLRRLVSECRETVHLGMVPLEDPHSVVYLDRVDSSHPVRIVTMLGSSAPSHSSAMGKAIIAHNPEFERAVLKGPLEEVTPRTLIDPEALRKDLALTRKRGYSMSVGEYMGEMVGIAAPVCDRVGVVNLGIGIWAPTARMTPEFVARTAPSLIDGADRISRQLGYVGEFEHSVSRGKGRSR